MDSVSDFESGGCGFESRIGLFLPFLKKNQFEFESPSIIMPFFRQRLQRCVFLVLSMIELSTGQDIPSQLHIAVGGDSYRGLLVTWITTEPAKSVVQYGKDPTCMKDQVEGKSDQYRFLNYTSGYIHRVRISQALETNVQFFCKIMTH